MQPDESKLATDKEMSLCTVLPSVNKCHWKFDNNNNSVFLIIVPTSL